MIPADQGCVQCGAYANARVGTQLVCDRCIALEHVSAGAIMPRQEFEPRVTEVTLTGEPMLDPADPSWQRWDAAP